MVSYGACYVALPLIGAKYYNEYVCLSVRLSVPSHNSKIARPNFTEFLCMLPMCMLPWLGHPLTSLRYISLYTFCSVDDVMFSYHGANGPESSRPTALYLEELPGVGTSFCEIGV